MNNTTQTEINNGDRVKKGLESVAQQFDKCAVGEAQGTRLFGGSLIALIVLF